MTDKKKSRFSALVPALPLVLGLLGGATASPPPDAHAITDATSEATAVVTRHSVVHAGPSAGAERVATLEEGAIVTLIAGGVDGGYVHVMYTSEDDGWISARNAHTLDAAAIDPPARIPAKPAPAGVAAFAAAAGAFEGCNPEGKVSAAYGRHDALVELNRLKNRWDAPADADMNPAVSLEKILAPGDDAGRWNSAQAASIEGYVYDVKDGTPQETVNCKSTTLADTHIEVTVSASTSGPRQRMIVEITPRWRAAAATRGLDWSTVALQQALKGHRVRFTGWLTLDDEHLVNAVNTSPNGTKIWRATAWELHPVTKVEVLPDN